MSGISVVISGASHVLSALHNLYPTVEERSERVIAAGALHCQRAAKRACPVGTPESTHKKGYHGGRLRASIRTRKLAPRVWDVYTDVYYAWWVEKGTRKMKARPYLYPAWVKYSRIVQRKLAKILAGRG